MKTTTLLLVSLGAIASACGSSTPAAPPPATEIAPVASAKPADTPAAAPSAAPAAVASAAPAAPPPAEPVADAPPAGGDFQLVTKTSTGRPMVNYSDEKTLTTTLGQHGGIIRIGLATLRIPDGALRDGVNVTFGLDPKAKPARGQAGPIYLAGPEYTSAGPRFQVVLPVPAGVKSPNFAVEVTKKDEKTGKPKTEWQILKPTKILSGEPNLAALEVDQLANLHFTLTTAQP